MSKEQRDALEGQLLAESYDIRRKFQCLFSDTRKSFEKNSVQVSDVATELVTLSIDTKQQTKGTEDQTPSLSVHQSEISEANSLKRVFTILAKFVSFFNYELLEHLIEQLSNDEDDKTRLTDYKNHLHEFCKRRVCEWPQQESARRENTIFVKLKDDFQNYTMESVKEFQYKLCRILEVSNNSVKLISVSDGCTEIVFLITSSNAVSCRRNNNYTVLCMCCIIY